MSNVIINKDGKEVNLNDLKTNVNQNIISTESKEDTVIKQPEQKHKENAITIDKLIDGYSKRATAKMKEEYLRTAIKVVPYIGYGTKIFLADSIIKASCLKDGQIYIDSCKKYLLYIFSLIDTYTNIELDTANWMFQYDRLDNLGLIEPILELIPEKETVTFRTILDMKLDDLMTNKYGVYNFISDQTNRIVSVAPEISKAFEPLMNVLVKKLENLDENKIEKMLNKATMMSKLVK